MSQTSQDWLGSYEGHYPTMASAVYLAPDEFLRHALDAYNLARRDLLPENGQRWLDPETNGSWSTAQGFYQGVMQRLGERLRRRALLTGHLVQSQIEDDASDNNAQTQGDGRSPSDMGHGWPAPAAGGPGRAIGHGVNGPPTSTAVISPSEDRL